MIKLNAELAQYFSEITLPFQALMAWKGEVYRALENRCTQRIEINRKSYFIKQHYGIGWKEIFKNIFQLRLPVLSAKNEWLAIQTLTHLGVAVPEIAGYGFQGLNPARMQSFLLTYPLPDHITLEELANQSKPVQLSFSAKRKFIYAVANIARTMHENGMNHRDFYLCHLLLDTKQLLPLEKSDVIDEARLDVVPRLVRGIQSREYVPKIYVIDLHRAQIRRKVPKRWLIKDLAGLYFSSMDVGLTSRDLLRFIKEYRNKPLKEIIGEKKFWQKVKQRGEKQYRKHTAPC